MMRTGVRVSAVTQLRYVVVKIGSKSEMLTLLDEDDASKAVLEVPEVYG